MDLERRRLYTALIARDARFDGVFFVGVTSTGVYCRPVCPARTPKAANCRFFVTPPEAEQAGFRPCLRCRPELAPGSAPVDDAQRIAQLIVHRLAERGGDETAGLEAIADQFELSSRQLRRIVRKQLGVAPIQLLLTRRLLLAKQLLTETGWPVTEVAFASGFSSVRRFNAAFQGRYRMAPTRLRQAASAGAPAAADGTSTLQLAYRPPFDWDGLLAFLGARALRGVEHVTANGYARTVRLGAAQGWVSVARSRTAHALDVTFTHTLTLALPALLARVRALFDLDARPDLIARHLRQDRRLAAAVAARAGMRVPGAFDGFELAVRAILGQQVTVAAATTVAGRFADAFGEPVRTPYPELTRLTPTAARVAGAGVDDIIRQGILASRARSVLALAAAQQSGGVALDGVARPRPGDAIRSLMELPGVGPWTAQYIAMRALRWPDAFPKEDVALRNRLGGVSASEAEAQSQAWRPWRSYAVMHLWAMAAPVRPASKRGNGDRINQARHR